MRIPPRRLAMDACSLHRYEVSLRYTPRNKLACGRPIVAMKNFREERTYRENETLPVLDVLLDAVIFLALSYRRRKTNALNFLLQTISKIYVKNVLVLFYISPLNLIIGDKCNVHFLFLDFL